MLALFDSPVIVTNCSIRPTSTIPLQSLALLNSVFVRSRAQEFALRLEHHESNPQKRVELAFRISTGRSPDAAERAAAERFLTEQATLYDQEAGASATAEVKASQQNLPPGLTRGTQRAWHDFCQMLFAGNAFLYVD
jgi:hypothetical protein